MDRNEVYNYRVIPYRIETMEAFQAVMAVNFLGMNQHANGLLKKAPDLNIEYPTALTSAKDAVKKTLHLLHHSTLPS